MALIALAGLVAGFIVATPAASAATKKKAAATPTYYYVSMGDSLSQSYQPSTGNSTKGYVDSLYTSMKATYPTLVLEKFGCDGETTTTLIYGGGNCTYTQGSQLKAAEAFMTAHKGYIKYVTLDIGANDIDACAPTGVMNYSCIWTELPTVNANIYVILAGISAADRGAATSAGMTYYDPYIATLLAGQGSAVATFSVSLFAALNYELSTAYKLYGWGVADVATAFDSTDFTTQITYPPYGTIAANLAYICAYTYLCTPLVNLHANTAGYDFIASIFRPVLGLAS